MATLVLMLFLDTAPYDGWWETYILFPAIGVLVATVLLAWVYEVFAMTLPMLLDMLRTLFRLLLPYKYAAPLSAAITRWWGRMPVWMREGTWLMPEDEPFEPKSKRPPR